MTLFNLQIEDKIYRIDLYPEVRVSITRHMMQLYTDFCAVNPDKQVTFDEYLNFVATQPHPENQVVEATDEDIEEDAEDVIATLCEQVRRKDVMIDALLEAIGKMK
jgi:hypothetical protein